MEKENFNGIFEWRIENFSSWCKDVHGKSIDSPPFSSRHFTKMELYPRGRNAIGEGMFVRIHDIERIFHGEFQFFGSDGSSICTRRVKGLEYGKTALEIPAQRYETVVDAVKKNGGHLTMRLCIRSEESYEKCMCTRLDVMKVSLKIDERLIGNVEKGYSKCIAFIPFSDTNKDWEGTKATRKGETFEGLQLKAARKNGKFLQLLLEHVNKKKNVFSVKSCISVLKRMGCPLNIHEAKEHVFCGDALPWTFSDLIKMEELVGKSVTLLLTFKIVTGSVTKSYHHLLHERRGVSIVSYNNISEDVTSNQTDELVASTLTKDFTRLFKEGQDFSDVQLKCGNVSFPVHRAILSARCPVFKRHLLSSSDTKEAESTSMDIEDLDPTTLTRFLVFLYTGTIEDLQWDSALKLYYAAQKYQVQTLKKKCSAFIRNIVSLSNVCYVLCIADKYQDEEMTSAAHDFILENYNNVLRSEEWKVLMKRQPVLAVEMENCVGKRDPQ